MLLRRAPHLALLISLSLGCDKHPAAGSKADAGPSFDAGAPLADGGGGIVLVPALVDGGPMGGVLFDGGASFRVWAPDAQSVTVTGDFGSQPLAPLGDGTFWGVAASAQAQQSYAYQITTSGQVYTRIDPRAFLIGSDPGGQEPPGLLYDPSHYPWTDAGFVPPPLNQAVIYELHVGTFVDPSGLGHGTYASAATKLADLQQLGVNMVELMPVAEFPGSYSWGYNPIYPSAACRAYGSPADLQAFIDQAHQLGLGVILDVVYNHFGLDSQHTPSLSMWCFDGPCSGGGIYFSPEPATPFGPRPAFGTPEVHDLIVDALRTWFSDYHVDGLRWDSAIATRTTGLDGTSPPLPAGARLMRDANSAVHGLDPAAITVAEDLQEWAPITEPVDPTLLDVYDSGYGFNSQWDDGFYYALLPLLTSAEDSQRDVTTLVTPLTGFPPMQRVVYTEDHDKVAPQNGAQFQRIPTLIGSSDNDYYAKRRAGLGLAVVLTAPAVPMLFMGQEFLETLPFPFSPGQALDWSNEQTFSGFRQMISDLIALRENKAGHTAGLTGNHIEIFDVTNTHNGATAPSIVYHRWAQGGAGDDVVVAANFSTTPLAFTIGFPQPGTWQVRFNSDDTSYSPDFTGTPSTPVTTAATAVDGQPQSGRIQLGPYSVVILSQ